MHRRLISSALMLGLIGALGGSISSPTEFTFQGRLTDSGLPVNGVCDLRFTLWAAENSTEPLAENHVRAVTVVDGLITVTLDFGAAAFHGDPRWLEVAVKGNDSASFVTLSPRHQVRPVPYALHATNPVDQPGPPLFLASGSDTLYTQRKVGIGFENPQTDLHLGGAMTLGHTTLTNPPAGTLRWTGTDFEGYTGQAWRSLTGGPSPLPNMVRIQAGKFRLGSPENEPGRHPDEGPLMEVTFSDGFWLGKYEVTQAEFTDLMGSNPSGFTGDGQRPVENVTWHDAARYCARLTERERSAGRISSDFEYRLPTEAEWEYACRAGSTTRFSHGYQPSRLHLGRHAWFEANSSGQSQPVGQRSPNPWGLHDMHGGVAEWCADWFLESYPGGHTQDPAGPNHGWFRVCRGGSWADAAERCRSASRAAHAPEFSSPTIGFRVALARRSIAVHDPRRATLQFRRQDTLIVADPRRAPLLEGVPGAEFHLDGAYARLTSDSPATDYVLDRSGHGRHARVVSLSGPVTASRETSGVLLYGQVLEVAHTGCWLDDRNEFSALATVKFDGRVQQTSLMTLSDGVTEVFWLKLGTDERLYAGVTQADGTKAEFSTETILRPTLEYCLAGRLREGLLDVWINGLPSGRLRVHSLWNAPAATFQLGGALRHGLPNETLHGSFAHAAWYRRGLEDHELAWNVTRWMSSRGIFPWGGYPEGVVHQVNEAEIIAQDPTQQTFLLPWTLMPPGRTAVGVLYQRSGTRADDGTQLTVTQGSVSASRQVQSRALPGRESLVYVEDGVLLEHTAATLGPIHVAFPDGQLKGIVVRAPQGNAPAVFDQGGALFCHPTVLRHSNGKTYWTDQEIYSGDIYLSDSSGKTVHVFAAPGSAWNDRLHIAAVLGELASGDLVVAATFHVSQRCFLRLLSPDLEILSPVRNLGGSGLYTYLHLAVTADDRLHLLSRGSVDGTSSTTAVRLQVTGAQSIGRSPPAVERDQITSRPEDWMYPVYWRVHRDPQTAEEYLIAGWRPVSGGKTARGLAGAIWHPASNRWFTWAGQSADNNAHNGTISSPRFDPQRQRRLVTHGGLNSFLGSAGEQVWQIPQQPGLWATLDSHRPDAPTASIMTVLGRWTGSITSLGAPSFLLHSYAPRDGVINQTIWPDYRPLTALGGGSIVPVSDSAALMVVTERNPLRLYVDVMGEIPNGFYDLGGTQLGLYLLTRSKGRPICRRLTGTESLPGWVEPTLTMTHVDYAAGNHAALQFRVLAGVNELHPTHRGSRNLLLSLPGVKPPTAH